MASIYQMSRIFIWKKTFVYSLGANDMTSIIFNDHTTLNEARSLLYQCYFEHFSWEIAHENPSGIKILRDHYQSILCDDYDQIAKWFVAFEQKVCVACIRLCVSDSKGLLEIERYENAKAQLKHLFNQKQTINLIELNREAILPNHCHQESTMLLLLKSVFEYCLKNKHTLITTTNLPEWVKIYDKIELNKLNITFKYIDSEPKPVFTYLANLDNIAKVIKNINLKLDSLEKQELAMHD